MKTYFKIIAIMLFTMSFFSSCEKSNTPISDLKFSVNEHEVFTNDLEYSFDILSGGGNYKAEVLHDNEFDKYAIATVAGNKVNVKLVSRVVRVKVTDQYGQQKDLTIISSNNSLQSIAYDIAMGYGFQHKSKFEFGSGSGYSILKTINPGYAELMINDNGEYVANSLAPGITTFVIKDSRGTINYARIGVWGGWNLNDNSMKVNVTAGYQYTFVLKWGEGILKISDCSSELKNPWLLIKDKNQFQNNQVLQVCVNQGSVGEFYVELVDASNNKAKITLIVER